MEEGWKLERISFGIRHRRTFQATDKFGEFVDKIVPLEGQYPFPEKCFTKVWRPDKLSVEVRDVERTLSVVYSTDGVVLDCDMLAEPPIETDTVLQMFKEISDISIPLTEGKTKIDRLGVLFNYIITPFQNSAKEIFSRILNININGTADEINMKFALKLPVSEAVYLPDKKTDYKNVFIGISSERKNIVEDENVNELSFPTSIRLLVDYQIYYVPERDFKSVDMKAHYLEAQEFIGEIVKKSNLNFPLSINKV